jgi:hypothetical protein
MACRASRGEWIRFRNNEGSDIKYSVRLQTDSMAVLCTATVAGVKTSPKSTRHWGTENNPAGTMVK